MTRRYLGSWTLRAATPVTSTWCPTQIRRGTVSHDALTVPCRGSTTEVTWAAPKSSRPKPPPLGATNDAPSPLLVGRGHSSLNPPTLRVTI